MVQNRNKLIDLFIGNLSNSIVHEILEQAMIGEIVADKYRELCKNAQSSLSEV